MLAVRQLNDSKNCGPTLIVKLWDGEDLTSHASGSIGGTGLQGWQTAASEWPVVSTISKVPTQTHTSNLPGWPLAWASSPLPVLTVRYGDLGVLGSLFLTYSLLILFSTTLVSTGIENNKQFFTYLKFLIMSFSCLFSLWKITHDAVLPGTWGFSNSGLHSFFCFYT